MYKAKASVSGGHCSCSTDGGGYLTLQSHNSLTGGGLNKRVFMCRSSTLCCWPFRGTLHHPKAECSWLKNTLGKSISWPTVSQNRKGRQAASISCSLLEGDRSLLKWLRLQFCSLKAINASIKGSSIFISWHVFYSAVGKCEGPEWITIRDMHLLRDASLSLASGLL